MESYVLPAQAYPDELQEITLALWTDVVNAAEVRQRFIAASTMAGDQGILERQLLDFAFLDGSMIASRDHILTAAHNAILGAAQGDLKTQTVHSEIIHHLNPASNIGEGLRRFGGNASSSSIMLVKISHRLTDSEKADLHDRMASFVSGKLAPLDALNEQVNILSLKKLYKVDKDTELPDDLLITWTALNKTVGLQ
ncbi:hypothetical protein EMMF5_006269 [Cystobasidiomycetes sp. EMM_F5]